ncbi:MAG: NAD(P)-binding domain-containing protein [Deltaproteobacteria bacterium]|nr:NAD(P)-binding domain-containing protein [Deltaproteobacteria bacterium]
MSDTWSIILFYGVPLLVAWAIYARRRSRAGKMSEAILSESREQDLMQPASLHPRINPGKCIGSGACVDACPEKNVLGMIAGRAQLITPANCIGHGACMTACPVDAIDLVIGTQQRGIEIPLVSPDFETNVAGIFVAGELGGMGLIRNGIEQGRQAIESIRNKNDFGRDDGADVLDVVIVGAGPAGISASLAAKLHGLRFRTVEQETLGGTVAHYPRGKVVMTAPVDLPGYGKVKLRETTKEALLELWKDVINQTDVEINYGERVDAIGKQEGTFVVRTDKGSYRTQTVLLAVGRRGTPRKLEVPGEHMKKVLYKLVNPEQYQGMKVLVVGGGDSALEAAQAIAGEPRTHVTLAYRSASFSRAKSANRERVEDAAKQGSLDIQLESTVVEIRKETVPTAFLRSVGIEVETRHGEVRN